MRPAVLIVAEQKIPTRRGSIIIAVLFAGLFGIAQARPSRTFLFPDGKFVVNVSDAAENPSGVKESVVDIAQKNGVVLAHENYTSEDGEHGFLIDRAA
jgi:hypothetical protein